jgi:nitroreductase
MEFSELIQQRYSARSYRPKPVEDKKLLDVLEAARLAPTAANRQSYQLILIKTAGREEELARIYKPKWFVEAPYVIAAIGLPEGNWVRKDGRNYTDVDVAIVMDHLILAAANAGLGTCWIGAFDPDAAREVLGLPDEAEPLAFTPLGYPADEPAVKRRKPLSDLVRYERW